MLLEDLAEVESQSYGSSPETLDLRPFASVIGKVTKYAYRRSLEIGKYVKKLSVAVQLVC